jgi:hypothetical protein
MGSLPRTITTRELLDLPADYAPVPESIAARLHPLAHHPIAEHELLGWERHDDRDIVVCEVAGITMPGSPPVRFLHILPADLYRNLPPVTDVLGATAEVIVQLQESRLVDRIEEWMHGDDPDPDDLPPPM